MSAKQRAAVEAARAVAWSVIAKAFALLGILIPVVPLTMEPLWLRLALALNMTVRHPEDGGTAFLALMLSFSVASLVVALVAALNARDAQRLAQDAAADGEDAATPAQP